MQGSPGDVWSRPFPEIPFSGGRLRQWESGDAELLDRAWRDAEIARWNPVPPSPSPEVAGRWIAGVDARREQRTAADFVIDVDGRGPVGEVGLSGFSPRHRGALIGYWLLEEARGRGLAASAVIALTSWAHDALGLEVVVARCHRNNAASHHVAGRAGYRREGTDDEGFVLWRSRPSATDSE